MKPSTPARVRPLTALRALGALLDDPDDTAQFFTFVESLAGRSPERTLRRLRATPDGRRLLADKPDLIPRLANRAALEACPEGSLARAYLAFMDRAGITAGGLVAASARGAVAPDAGEDADLAYVGDRLRDTHDLWHVVTGFGPDLVGEAGVLAFTFAQTRAPGIGAFLAVVLARRLPGAAAVVRDAFARGSRAAPLLAVRWEELLARPLDEVRALLGVGRATPYVPLTTEQLRAEGILPARRAA